jgi:hypothetical protein
VDCTIDPEGRVTLEKPGETWRVTIEPDGRITRQGTVPDGVIERVQSTLSEVRTTLSAEPRLPSRILAERLGLSNVVRGLSTTPPASGALRPPPIVSPFQPTITPAPVEGRPPGERPIEERKPGETKPPEERVKPGEAPKPPPKPPPPPPEPPRRTPKIK